MNSDQLAFEKVADLDLHCFQNRIYQHYYKHKRIEECIGSVGRVLDLGFYCG